MSDPASPNVNPPASTDTNPAITDPPATPQAAPPATPPSPVPPTPPTPTPPTPPTPSAPQGLRPEDEIVDGDQSYRVKDLIQNHRQFEELKAAHQAALSGDPAAVQRYVQMFQSLGDDALPSQPMPEPPSTPSVNGDTPPSIEGLTPEEAATFRKFINQQQVQEIRTRLGEVLKNPELIALAQREDAVDLMIEKLNNLNAQKIEITPEVVNWAAQHLNEREKKYQEKILAGAQIDSGKLGVNDPFRGGPPVTELGEPPNPWKEPEKHKKWLAGAFKHALAAGSAETSPTPGSLV